ncbi:conserved hypothetical protein [Plasmopara halstedii]|uniref:ATPase dynein-related AAA domain-containing protein n=1 Tax=Plasmopara halstedii TaxID=4781 RepID=A0A0N7L5N8_PLAHL|nr:conserved hypothetical protein [Plasmopara halstedii]CEG41995.1 conserved hypothetical protein [Plasmopara halstedii]|eukprot:XP_024578364.1 conserved hypothetical protein [Plasmopara halstedii]
MFSFHSIPAISCTQSAQIIRSLFPTLPTETTSTLLAFSDKLQSALKEQSNREYLALSLSTRQILRICRRLNAFPEQSQQDLRPLVHDALLTQFLSRTCKQLVDSLFNKCKAPNPTTSIQHLNLHSETIRVEGGHLYIDNVLYPVQTPKNPELVPQPHYFDIPKHTRCMKHMLQDVVAGQKHLLLIGNQGVGKNKLADRLLQLLQQEREYIQLHRDTTVQTLTLIPTLLDGRIVWEDSPLVRAAKAGRTLIVDEADKAPLEVVCVLKGLIEDGEMLLGNGKRLIDPTKTAIDKWHDKDRIITLHPNFRMWVLANRPGFPFLGNNFFREIGDIFATHAIENPDEESELALLTAYAPSVSTDILRRLCKAFAELRELVETGSITYPYSTREAVAVAKHLERFPNDGVPSVLENVLAFDAYDRNVRKQLSELFVRNGIPLSPTGEVMTFSMNIAKTRTIPKLISTESWRWVPEECVQSDTFVKKSQIYHSSLDRQQIWVDPPTTRTFSVDHHRLHQFTEQVASFQVPIKENKQQVYAMAVFPDNSIHVLTTQPMSIHSFSNFEGEERKHIILELENEYVRWETNPIFVSLPKKRQVAIFMPSTGVTIVMNPLKVSDGRITCLTLPNGALDGRLNFDASVSHSIKSPFTKWFGGKKSGSWRTLADGLNAGILLRFIQEGSLFQLIDLNSSKILSIDLATTSSSLKMPISEILSVQPVGKHEWLVRTRDDKFVYKFTHNFSTNEFTLELAAISYTNVASVSSSQSIIPGQRDMANKARFMVHPHAFLQTIDINGNDIHVHSALRENLDHKDVSRNLQQAWQNESCIVNSSSGDVVDLEVTFPELRLTKTIVVPNDSHRLETTTDSRVPRVVGIADSHDGSYTITLQEDGTVRVWQLNPEILDREAQLWRQMFGNESDLESHGSIEIKLNGSNVGGSSIPKTGLNVPKHGKEDPKNDPHVGGNTWAGGSGGGGKQYMTLTELKDAILKAWENLDMSRFQNLVKSMPDRIGDVIEDKGKKTKH